jgi:hypothetical protein
VTQRIAAACTRSGRDPASVQLVAVSKQVSVERVRELADLGQAVFGENRVQEALAKIPAAGPGLRWHLVGHLQRNKARLAVGAFELIHSVDDLDLAREIDRRAAAAGLVQAVLVEVNVAGEASKHGAPPAELQGLVEALAGLAHIDLRGLMCVPPIVDAPDEARRWFGRLRDLRDEAVAALGRPLPHLSMGMSDDFDVAVEEGATCVRIGRALFGARTL